MTQFHVITNAETGEVSTRPFTQEEVLNSQETPEQTIARLEKALDDYLDKEARSLRYDSIKTIVTYRDDENPKFKSEGIAGYRLRSNVYTLGIQIMEEVLLQTRPIPTESELIAEMPKITDYLIY